MEHFPCCNFFAHRDCVDDGIDAMCPFCRMDVREVLDGGPDVRFPIYAPRGCVIPSAWIGTSMGLRCLCRATWGVHVVSGGFGCRVQRSRPLVAASSCMSLASPDVSQLGGSCARSATSPSLSTRGQRDFRRLRCFTGA